MSDLTREAKRVLLPGALTAGAFHLAPKEWETEFFGRPFGSLTWRDTDGANAGPEAIYDLCAQADVEGYALIECHVDSRDFTMIPVLEEHDFRFVDTRARFLTRWSSDLIEESELTQGRIMEATAEHRDRIVDLTHEGFTFNDRFMSRFKNPDYFTLDETRRYFEAWIDNTAFSDGAVSAVYEVEGEIVGYYIYEITGTHQGLPLMKGILTAVSPEHRGANAQLALQSYLYRAAGFTDWYLDNTTQITNKPVIRNHNRSGKLLSEIVFTLFRKAVM